MAKASDNQFPKLLLIEGTTPATPPAGVHGLFVDTADDKLKRVDSAGTVSTVEGGGGGGGSVAVARAQRTAGDLTIGATPTDTTLEVVLAAAAGDWIEVGVSGLWNAGATLNIFGTLNVATRVSGATVNYLSSGTSSYNNGILSMFAPAASVDGTGGLTEASGTFMYQLQAGDVSGGNATLRLYGKTGSSSRVLRASATDPLTFWAKNLG